MQNSEARKRKEEAERTIELSVEEALDQVMAGLLGMHRMLQAIVDYLEGRSNASDQQS